MCCRAWIIQGIFFGSHFDLFLNEHWFSSGNRLGAAYFHGKPGTGNAEFDSCFECLQKHHEQVACIQVSYSEMRDVVLGSGISPEKVHLIPIGISQQYFRRQTAESKKVARMRYGVPPDAFVLGSFQKDGEGWKEGLRPKLVKGPDVFVEVVRQLKDRVPSLFVLLGGPSRGYVKRELDRMGVPYAHHWVKQYPEIGEMFQAIDVYVVASREEGGPKAVLESMASGVPLVSTRVGQAMDLVSHNENGWMVDVEDADGLTDACVEICEKRGELVDVIDSGLQTAELNSYESQLPQWKLLLESLVDIS